VVGYFDFEGDGLKHPLQYAACGEGAESGEKEGGSLRELSRSSILYYQIGLAFFALLHLSIL